MSTEKVINVCHEETFNSLHMYHINCAVLGLFFICDLCVYQELFLGLLTSSFEDFKPCSLSPSRFFQKSHRSDPSEVREVYWFAWGFLPWLGVPEFKRCVRNLSLTVDEIINEIIYTIKIQQKSFDLLALLVINGPSHSLQDLLTSQVDICTLANISYCF